MDGWLGLSRHSDGGHAAGDPMHIKIAFYLDPLTADSGSLRVIPGSHRIGDAYATALNDAALREPGIGGAEVPAVAFETVAGDVVVFNHNTKHCFLQRRRAAAHVHSERLPEVRLS